MVQESGCLCLHLGAESPHQCQLGLRVQRLGAVQPVLWESTTATHRRAGAQRSQRILRLQVSVHCAVGCPKCPCAPHQAGKKASESSRTHNRAQRRRSTDASTYPSGLKYIGNSQIKVLKSKRKKRVLEQKCTRAFTVTRVPSNVVVPLRVIKQE